MILSSRLGHMTFNRLNLSNQYGEKKICTVKLKERFFDSTCHQNICPRRTFINTSTCNKYYDTLGLEKMFSLQTPEI